MVTLDKAVYGTIKGTKSMFRIKYECTNEALAPLAIAKDCTRSTMDLSAVGRSVNFISYKVPSEPTGSALADWYGLAADEWSEITTPLESDGVYRDKNIEAFANMIYYKTLAFGCMHRFCVETKSLAIACAFGAM
ncbi:hypothetical protein OESDEN_16186 [Oesophagostomum dentatum]|uniref:SCP domain-containing protein n=1 Tax=Oesophagostomum dentatum TaxID=61180 RepID=A0A0B1SGS1_OESDE|nr:hypothetical protein OESDEN_16186 [Oesophagostomum dentatum]